METVLGATFDPLAEDPYPFYRQARQNEPIVYCPPLDAWLVTCYKDIQSILLQPEIFSSRDTLTSPVTFYPGTLQELLNGSMPVPIVLNSDGAEHTRFRIPLTKAFAPSRIRAMEPFVQDVANKLIDVFIADGQTDIVSRFAYPLALEVVLKLLGIPSQDIEQTRVWSQDWLMLMSVQLEEAHQLTCAKNTVAFQKYLAELIEERRREPQDDLISSLLAYASESP
jgi:cytochrome P450